MEISQCPLTSEPFRESAEEFLLISGTNKKSEILGPNPAVAHETERKRSTPNSTQVHVLEI